MSLSAAAAIENESDGVGAGSLVGESLLDGRDYRNGCIFNEHYYLKAAGRYYDPCLSTSYERRDESIKEKFEATLSFMVGPGLGRKFLVTRDRRTAIYYMPQENVAGFTGAYAMFDCNRKSIEKALGKREFQTEMNVRGGATAFARSSPNG